MGGRRRPVTGRLYAGKGAAAEIRSPLILVPPITAMEEGAGGGAGAGPLASSSAATPKAAAPVDRYHLAYAIFYLQGVGQLFPWNAFITAGPYFSQRFCGTAHADDFENYFSLTFMLTNLAGQALCVRYAPEMARRCGSVTARITGALAVLLLVFLAIMLLVLFKDVPRNPLFGFTNLGVAIAGACTSLLQAAIFGYAAVFPPRYTQAMMAGQGLAGLMVAVAGLATAASSGANPCESLARHNEGVAAGGEEEDAGAAICSGYDRVDYHAFGYFGACVVILGLCMLSFLFLETMPLARYYTRKLTRPPEAGPHAHALAHPHPRHTNGTSAESDEEGAALVNVVHNNGSGDEAEEAGDEQEEEAEGAVDAILTKQGSGSFLLEDPEAEAHAAVASAHAHAHGHGHHATHGPPPPPAPVIMMARSAVGVGDDDGEEEMEAEADDPTSAAAAHHQHQHHRLPFLRMLCALGSPGAAVFLVFAVTLAVFPSLTVHVVSAARCRGKGAFYDKAFVPFQFLLFNLCDFLGRTLAGAGTIVPASRLWLWTVARVGFVPLFLLCNVEGSALPTLFPSDWWPTLFMLAFATSNGYLSSLAMMDGPQQLGPHASPALAEAAGVTMVLLMTMGLGAGSALSFVVLALSQGGF